MKLIKTKFKGLKIIQNKNNFDLRGNLVETYKKKNINKNYIFDYYSNSKKNVIRGLHFQTKNQQEKYITILNGSILDVCLDLRKNSPTFGNYFSIFLSNKNFKSILIPEGFAHGYFSLEDNTILYYKNSSYYSDKEQKGIIWNDKDLNIKWPTNKPILSNKDKENLTFKEFLKNYKFL